MPSPNRVASETLGALHRDVISSPAEVRRILGQAAERGSVLRVGLNRLNAAEIATIAEIGAVEMILTVDNIRPDDPPQRFFNFELGDVQYFFGCSDGVLAGTALRVRIPDSIYRAERRDLKRA